MQAAHQNGLVTFGAALGVVVVLMAKPIKLTGFNLSVIGAFFAP